jgi:hypothetical protein
MSSPGLGGGGGSLGDEDTGQVPEAANTGSTPLGSKNSDKRAGM